MSFLVREEIWADQSASKDCLFEHLNIICGVIRDRSRTTMMLF
jgi:hypothetical protein